MVQNFKWNDKAKTINILSRKGSFPGMLEERKFNIILVGESNIYKEIDYRGKAISLKF